MRLRNILQSISKKIMLIILGILVSLAILIFIWKSNKYKIVKDEIRSTIAMQTDSLYIVKYDSIHFDALTGQAYLRNVHIAPDTVKIKSRKLEDLPYFLLDITISSLKVTGVKTDKALLGKQLIGDSVVIDHPDVIVYFVKPVEKKTKLDVEAKTIYNEILGNLTRIQVNQVFINNVHIKGAAFFTKENDFDLVNGNIQLNDVLIDSAHNLDTTRTLFCKQATLNVASFITFDNNRPEFRVNKINFSANHVLSFEDIAVNRFESENGDSSKLLYATNLILRGINTNEIVKNKNIIVDTITCTHITLYQPPAKNVRNSGSKPKQHDSTGFRHVYSIDMKHLGFPKVVFVPFRNSGYTLGNIAIKINEVKADEIMDVQNHPLDYSKEAEISCDRISMNSKDGFYKYIFENTSINSLKKEFKISSFTIKPFLGEAAFASKAHFQKDRYDVSLTGISLKNIDMNNLLDKKLFASTLVVNNTSAKIYRDLQKPLNGKNRLGNYPSQMLKKLDIPVNISHVQLTHAYIQYKEKETVSDTAGVVAFEGTSISISNITNLPDAIAKNNATVIFFESKVLGTIPIKGQFKFFLTGNGGNFEVNGHVSKFDALNLNKISVPMALMRLNTGTINAIDFNFTGNDYGAKGDFVMKYENLKVDVLKRDKDTKVIKKKGLTSLIANIIVKNNNPGNNGLRKVDPKSERDIHKSFFNLVWKTIFVGMKKTLGLP